MQKMQTFVYQPTKGGWKQIITQDIIFIKVADGIAVW